MEFDYHDQIQNHHGFRILESWSRGEALLNTVGKSHEIALSVMANLSEANMIASPSIGVMHHLTERAYEQLLGAITCFSTKNAASSEVLSRVVTETCVNILFMLNEDTDSALCCHNKS